MSTSPNSRMPGVSMIWAFSRGRSIHFSKCGGMNALAAPAAYTLGFELHARHNSIDKRRFSNAGMTAEQTGFIRRAVLPLLPFPFYSADSSGSLYSRCRFIHFPSFFKKIHFFFPVDIRFIENNDGRNMIRLLRQPENGR